MCLSEPVVAPGLQTFEAAYYRARAGYFGTIVENVLGSWSREFTRQEDELAVYDFSPDRIIASNSFERCFTWKEGGEGREGRSIDVVETYDKRLIVASPITIEHRVKEVKEIKTARYTRNSPLHLSPFKFHDKRGRCEEINARDQDSKRVRVQKEDIESIGIIGFRANSSSRRESVFH